jgi:hypothetical protein
MPAGRVSGNRLARCERRLEGFCVYNFRYLSVRIGAFVHGRTYKQAGPRQSSGDAYTFSQYEKMFANAGFVKTTQYPVPDSPQQLLLSEK